MRGSRRGYNALAVDQKYYISLEEDLARQRLRTDRTLVDMAVRDLRESILSGERRPGSPLVLIEVADQLGMSVMPIREAIRRLQAEGLVEQIPHRGARVSGISVSDLEDLYSVRIPLEAQATRQAALRFTEADYERLSGVLDEYLAAHRRGDDARGREMHAAFHLGLYEVSGSRWLLRTIGPLWEAAERYQRLSSRLRGTLEERHAEHRQILEHCRNRDAEAAGAALEEHLRRTMNTVRAEIGESEDGSGDGDG
jgi:DNA-binding GntR family transcriptional regulator